MPESFDPIQRRFPTFSEAERRCASTLIELAFAEDLGTESPGLIFDPQSERPVLERACGASQPCDLTSEATIPASGRGAALFVARSGGVVAGLPVAWLVARRYGLSDGFELRVNDGTSVEPGAVVAEVRGSMRALLAYERTALNFLQRLSGVATLTARFVAEVAGTRAVILDTRKTTPGWRALEKYAVRCGGGKNHRFGLYDAVLIKDNHLAWLALTKGLDAVVAAIQAARDHAPPGTIIEVEVDSLEQFDLALTAAPDIILVDNLGPAALAEAVRRRDAHAPSIQLEASGGVNLTTVAALARTGVDRISVGALTHSANALDIALDFARDEPT